MHALASTWHALPEFWLTACLVMARLLGFVLVLPNPGGRHLSVAFRGVLCFCLTVLVAPTCRVALPLSAEPSGWLLALAQEAGLGLLLGTGVHLLFWGIQVAGQLISQMAGISLASVYHGAGDRVSSVTRLLDLLAMALFLVVGGHRLVIGTLLNTFREWPPGSFHLSRYTADLLAGLLTHSLILGLEAVLPVVAVLLISNLLAGILGRLMPQMNVLLLSSGMNSLLLMASLFVGMGAMAWTMQNHWEPFLGEVVRICDTTR